MATMDSPGGTLTVGDYPWHDRSLYLYEIGDPGPYLHIVLYRDPRSLYRGVDNFFDIGG